MRRIKLYPLILARLVRIDCAVRSVRDDRFSGEEPLQRMYASVVPARALLPSRPR